MTSHDDYRHEVDRLSTEQVEALVGEIRQELVKELPVWVVQRHLTAMAGARGGGEADANRRSRMSLFGRRRLVVAVAAALAVAAGAAAALTVADRSDQARQPSQNDVRPDVDETGPPMRAGVPQEGTEPERNAQGRPSHGQDVSDFARGTALQGCQRGQAVSDRASEKAKGKASHRADDRDPCDRSDRAKGDQRGSGRGTHGGKDSAPGQQRPREPRGGGPPFDPGPPPGVDTGPRGPRAVVP